MKTLIASILIFILIGCGGGGSGVKNESTKELQIKQTYKVEISRNKIIQFKNITKAKFDINLKKAKDLFIVITSKSANQKVKVIFNNQNKNISFAPSKKRKIVYKNSIIQSDNNATLFCVKESDGKCTKKVAARLLLSKKVLTKYGVKKLLIWQEVNQDLNQDAINELASSFLKEGENNDIYDYLTLIYGSEWAGEKSHFINMINPKGKINILLYRFDSSTKVGYFSPKDLFLKEQVPASNQKLIIYLNSTYLEGFLPNTALLKSTLVHEFTHMVSYYQRNIIKGINDAKWFKELMALASEDLLAFNLHTNGIRNVIYYDGSAGDRGNKGIFCNYNRACNSSIFIWDNKFGYAKEAAFAAFLLRNFNGPYILEKLAHSNKKDIEALKEATKSDIYTLMQDFGIAVVLSDTILPYSKRVFNFGDFKKIEYRGVEFKLGSINFYNYLEPIAFKNEALLQDGANLYSFVGQKLKGKIAITIICQEKADVAFIAK